jgi:serine/threonine protein kinase
MHAREAPMIGQQVGLYRVVRRVGAGAMGEVFEAVQEQIRRRVAIKVLHPLYSRDPDICQRFFNEALAVNVIEHPNIVSISESGWLPGGQAFIVMEFLDGQSLSRRIRDGGPLTEREALRLCRQVAAALSAAHDKGIIHRDLKPDNVTIERNP